MRLHSEFRRGAATVVEFALVGPITFFLLISLLVGGMGIFRYQEVAGLARQASRYASVHGTGYALDTGNSPATANDVYTNAIAGQNVSLDLSKLQYSVTWNTTNAPYHTNTVNSSLVQTTNTVTVTITYTWIPEAYLGGITMTSTSTTPMSN